LRILMLSQFIYPPTIGGEERHVTDLCVELAARGHSVSIVAFGHKDFPAFSIERDVRIHRIQNTMQRMSMLFSENERPYAPPFPDPEALWSLRRIIQEEQPDIVHAHNWIMHSFTPLKAWSKASCVVSLHDYSLVCVQKRLTYHGMNCTGPELRKCLECGTKFYGLTKGPLTVLANRFWQEQERRAVDIFLPVSRAVAEGTRLDKYNVPYKIVPNFIPDRAEVASAEDHPLLAQLPKGDFMLFVGDVTADKGAEVLLQAYARLETQVPLVLIGRPLVPGLAEKPPANVHVMGMWPHDVVMAAWQRCLFGLVPSTWGEPLCSVALEAMHMGKPVIAARSGGLIDIVSDGETGILVPPQDPQALCNAMQSLLNNPTERVRMGKLAKQRVVAFQATSVVAHIEHVYRELHRKKLAVISSLIRAGGR
jgi:glycosyltransferase involved in cell wall biosynthesis